MSTAMIFVGTSYCLQNKTKTEAKVQLVAGLFYTVMAELLKTTLIQFKEYIFQTNMMTRSNMSKSVLSVFVTSNAQLFYCFAHLV